MYVYIRKSQSITIKLLTNRQLKDVKLLYSDPMDRVMACAFVLIVPLHSNRSLSSSKVTNMTGKSNSIPCQSLQ